MLTKTKKKKKIKYRSKAEARAAESLKQRKIKAAYEPISIPYILECSYTPDWRLPSGIFVEFKGRLDAYTMRKHKAIRKQHPDIDIRFVFQNANKKIRKGSKTTYGDWATKNGFMWAEGDIPNEWA